MKMWMLVVCGLIFGAPSHLDAQSGSPRWENDTFTKFRSTDCPSGVPDLIVRRTSSTNGSGSADILLQSPRLETVGGNWTLSGSALEVQGAGFSIVGTWIGNRLLAQLKGSGLNANCQYRVSGTSG